MTCQRCENPMTGRKPLRLNDCDKTLTVMAWHCSPCQNLIEEITVNLIGQNNILKRITYPVRTLRQLPDSAS